MLRPTDIESLKGDKSRYAVVVGVAKRARDIAERAGEDGTILIEKPVSMAINDLTNGDYKILMSEKPEDENDTIAAGISESDLTEE